MATDDNDINPSARRLRLRRGRTGGFAGGGAGASSRSESLRSSAEYDEVDEAIEPEDIDRQLRERAAANSPPPLRNLPPEDPRRRMQEVANSGSQKYNKEYRLSLLHRALMRNVPLDQIATQFGVSISTIEKDRVELKKRLREAAREMNIEEMVGGQTALYQEISGMAMRIAGKNAGDGAAPIPMQLAAMRTALAANADMNRFYNTAGVYDVLRFRRAEDGGAQSDIQLLMEQTGNLMQSLLNGSDNFDAFSGTDENDPEVMDL